MERICVSPIGTVPCMTNADCPAGPSGIHGQCMDATTQSSPGDGVYHTCWLPFFEAVDRFQCWAGNPGAPCGGNSDCNSNNCAGLSNISMGACK